MGRGWFGRAMPAGARGAFAAPPATLDLSTGGTFARSTEGSYYTGAPTDGSSAFLAWATSGTRRVENRGDGLGSCLLMEKSSTNYVLRSRQLDNASWTAGTATVTADANGGPDASTSADRVNAASGGYGPYQLTCGPSGVVIGSVWVRAVSGTASHQLYVVGNTATQAISARAYSTSTTYQRNATTAGTSAVTNSGILPEDAENRVIEGGQAATAQDCYLDLVQLEASYYPTSAIRTTSASVTRGADTLSYATGSYSTNFLTNGVTFSFAPDASSAEIVSASEDWRLVQVATSDYVQIVASGGVCKVQLICGSSTVGTLTVTFSRGQSLTITAKPSAGSLTVSGATTGNGTNTGSGAAWASSQTLYIGGNSLGTNNATGRFVGALLTEAT